ncbi:MAG: hypothetical protein JXR30_00440 [Alphaproteobacteria bacterium]|nr:hypothetical protein [Alphaproteobacteria bacterium]
MSLFLHHKRRRWLKPLLVSVGGLFLLSFILFASLPLIFSSETMRPQIEKALQLQMNLQAEVKGSVSFQFFPHPLIRAKKIEIGNNEEKMMIDKIDFHTSILSLFSFESLLSDLTFHHAEIGFKNFEGFIAFVRRVVGKGDFSFKQASLRIGESLFEPTDFSVYEEKGVQTFSFKASHALGRIGLTGQFSADAPTPLQGMIQFNSGETLEIQATYIPQTHVMEGVIEGSFGAYLPLFNMPFIESVFPLNIYAEFQTDFKNISIEKLHLKNKRFDYTGEVNFLAEEGWNIRGKVDSFSGQMESLDELREIFIHHPRGTIDVNGDVRLKSQYDGAHLTIEEGLLKSPNQTVGVSGSGFLSSEKDYSFDGTLAFQGKEKTFKGQFFLTPDIFEMKSGQYKLQENQLKGNLLFLFKQKSIDATLSASSLQGFSFLKGLEDWTVDLKLNAEKFTYNTMSFSSFITHALLTKDSLVVHALQARSQSGVMSAKGEITDSDFVDFSVEGKDLSFISGLQELNLPFINSSLTLTTKLLLNGAQTSPQFAFSQKTRDSILTLSGKKEKDVLEGELNFQTENTQFLVEKIPFLKGKISEKKLGCSGPFVLQKNLLSLPNLSIRFGENTLRGVIERTNLGEEQWKVSLTGENVFLSNLVQLSGFRFDIFDDQNLTQWESFLTKKLELSIDLKDILGTRLGKDISLSLNTLSFPQHGELRLIQENGDARFHFTQEAEIYKGLVHLENYLLPETFFEQEDPNVLLGYTTLESEFETKGRSTHALFKNMIASLKVSTTDTTLYGLSPFTAIEGAKQALGLGDHAVRQAVVRGLKSGSAPLESLSCRGVMKEGKVYLKYGRFSSPDFDNGTFTAELTPLKRGMNIQSRFGLQGLHRRPIDVIWQMTGTLFQPVKTVRITSPYAYDAGYLKRSKKKR